MGREGNRMERKGPLPVQPLLTKPHRSITDIILQALADPGGQGGSCSPPQTSDEHFLFCKITDFRTDWPTPGVVQMQKKLSVFGALPPYPWTGPMPLDPAGATASGPHYRLALLDCGTTFHPGFDGRDFRSTLLDDL